MRVVVTGGAGFIGSNLCRHLLAHPDVTAVAVIDDLSTGRRANLDGLAVEFVEGSVCDRAALDAVCSGADSTGADSTGADSIVHLAALGSVPRSVAEPMGTHEANATGTLEVLEAARRHGMAHTVVASSSSVYGATPDLPKHELLPTRPLSPYAVSKLATETYALAYQASYGLPTLAFRFFNVYGPHQPADHAYAAVIPRFVAAALRGEPLTIHGDGRQSRDFTHVDSVCAAIVAAVTARVAHDMAVNLAFGSSTDLLTLVELVAEAVGADLTVRHDDPRPGDVRHSSADCTLLGRLLPGIGPTPLPEGLAATVGWMRSQI